MNYGMLATTVGVVLLGGTNVLAKPYERGNAPAEGDAQPA